MKFSSGNSAEGQVAVSLVLAQKQKFLSVLFYEYFYCIQNFRWTVIFF